ncbi:MAG: hypothetical protein KC621_20895 [Myxococcales bacterium]|nr:hypothetical protein [Myxococcales bacterium]
MALLDQDALACLAPHSPDVGIDEVRIDLPPRWAQPLDERANQIIAAVMTLGLVMATIGSVMDFLLDAMTLALLRSGPPQEPSWSSVAFMPIGLGLGVSALAWLPSTSLRARMAAPRCITLQRGGLAITRSGRTAFFAWDSVGAVGADGDTLVVALSSGETSTWTFPGYDLGALAAVLDARCATGAAEVPAELEALRTPQSQNGRRTFRDAVTR